MAVQSKPKRPRLLQVFEGSAVSPPPVWLMRQAGRYLPEYRAVRAQAGSFLDLCYAPDLAAEVTMQPIRRYGFDAAILFADILLVPHALGQKLDFVEGEGPQLDPIRSERDLARLNPAATRDKFARVFETVAKVRQELPHDTALIGFCGAPWTVATYMVGGCAADAQASALHWAETDPAGFGRLIDLLAEVSVGYLAGQVAAGAQVVQIFDTWANKLSGEAFHRWVTEPTSAIVRGLKQMHPHVPVIGFPRGAGTQTAAYVTETGVDGVGCDTGMPLEFMGRELAAKAVVQGNLDPMLLVAGGEAMQRRVAEILTALSGKRFIFNLGHGIVPQTPPENVARLVDLVRGAK